MNNDYPTMNHNLEGLIPKMNMQETITRQHEIEMEDMKFNQVPDMREFTSRLGKANIINKFIPTE